MRLVLGSLLSLSLVACTTQHGEQHVQSVEQQWLKEGSLTIARPLPQVTAPSSSLFGFMPQKQPAKSKYQLTIDRSSGSATVFHGAVKISSIPLENVDGIEPGEYTVQHKQRHPVWYANDEYFTKRGLEVPAAQSKDRYLKGALGDFVIFLNDHSPLHNSAVFAEEVGGVRLEDNNIAKLYYQLEVGSVVRVQ